MKPSKKEQGHSHSTVKRRGHTEKYDERKCYGSIYAAGLSCHLKHTESEKIASEACKEITKWVHQKKKVSSDNIFKKVASHLKKKHADVAFMYETHRDIC